MVKITAVWRAAVTGIALFVLGVFFAIPFIGVIEEELFAGSDVSNRIDKNAAPFDDRLAVRGAGVIDKPGVASLVGGVDDGMLVHGEEKGVMSLHFVIVVESVGLFVGNPLAGIFNDPRPFRDRPEGKDAGAMDGRGADLEPLSGSSRSSLGLDLVGFDQHGTQRLS